MSKDNVFNYKYTKAKKVLIYRDNKLIKTLSEKESAKFIEKTEGADDQEIQIELAKVTGKYKHGNER